MFKTAMNEFGNHVNCTRLYNVSSLFLSFVYVSRVKSVTISNKQLRTADKGCSSNLGVRRWANSPSP